MSPVLYLTSEEYGSNYIVTSLLRRWARTWLQVLLMEIAFSHNLVGHALTALRMVP